MADILDPNSAAFTVAAEKIAKAQAAVGRNPFKHGIYRLMVDTMVLQSSEHNGVSFKTEFITVSSKQATPGYEPAEVDSRQAFVVNLTTNKFGAGNIVSFLLRLNGLDESVLPGDTKEGQAKRLQLIKEVCAPAQPLRGTLIDIETTLKQLDKPGKDGKMYAVYCNNWVHVPGQSDADVAARRAELVKRFG